MDCAAVAVISSATLRCSRPIEAPDALSHLELRAIRISAGHEETSGVKDKVQDWTLDGFDELMEILPGLEPEERTIRARLIWESLGDLEERRGRGVFDGLYSWTHYGSYKKDFPSAFIRRLNAAAWVPDGNGDLQPGGLRAGSPFLCCDETTCPLSTKAF